MTKSITLTPDSWLVTDDAIPSGELRSIIPGHSYAAITGRGDYANPLATQVLSFFDAASESERLRGEVVLFAPTEDIEATLLPVVRSFTASIEELRDPASNVMVSRLGGATFAVNMPKISTTLRSRIREAAHDVIEIEKEDLLDPVAWSALYENHRYEALEIVAREVFTTVSNAGVWMDRSEIVDDDEMPDGVGQVIADLWDHVVMSRAMPSSGPADEIMTWLYTIDFMLYLFNAVVEQSAPA